MRITTDHPASTFGRPVILNDDGEPMSDWAGFQAARRKLGLNVDELGAAIGKSGRTVQHYERANRGVPAEALYVLKGLLERATEGRRRMTD